MKKFYKHSADKRLSFIHDNRIINEVLDTIKVELTFGFFDKILHISTRKTVRVFL
jgi:hypothetical protein